MFSFNSIWLEAQYNTKTKIEQHPSITDEEREALKGLFERSKKGLAEEISSIDHKFIADTYYGKEIIESLNNNFFYL